MSDNAVSTIARPRRRSPPAMQDYLKAVYRLGRERLGHHPAAGRRAGRGRSLGDQHGQAAARAGLLGHEPYHGVTLTPTGRQVALDVVRRHRLLETYLAEAVGLGWDEVHDEAERLEHHLSDRLEARLDSLLGFPRPTPTATRSRARAPIWPSGPTLLQTPAGAEGTVSRVSDRDPEQLRYLGALGIVPGARVAVVEHLPSRARCGFACSPGRRRAGENTSWAGPGGSGAPGKLTPSPA